MFENYLQPILEYFNSEYGIPLVSFISAILGGLIQSLISHIFTNKEITLNKQREAYADYLDILQDYINHKDDDIVFENFQKATNKVRLFASENTAKLINDYFANSTTINEKHLTKEEHEKAHNNIFKSMRKDLRLKNGEIGICSIRRHIPSELTKD